MRHQGEVKFLFPTSTTNKAAKGPNIIMQYTYLKVCTGPKRVKERFDRNVDGKRQNQEKLSHTDQSRHAQKLCFFFFFRVPMNQKL